MNKAATPAFTDILIVDDEPDIRFHLSGLLEDEGFENRTAGGDTEFYECIAQCPPALVLLDIWLEGSSHDGLQLLKYLTENHPEIQVVMMSGHGTIDTAVRAIQYGAYDFVEKPFKTDRMLLSIRRALEIGKLKAENQRLKATTPKRTPVLMGSSAAATALRQQVSQLSAANTRVLIKGDPGTGKETTARLIHEQSTINDGEFVVFSCAGEEPERIEQLLFGSSHDGLLVIGAIERASAGTVYIEEITDLPLDFQARLARALQTSQFERGGEKTPVSINARVMAASAKDLNNEMEQGRLRQELYYRLNVGSIDLPPLQKRSQDVGELMQHALTNAASAAGKTCPKLDKSALTVLMAYNWPGNIRQLKNMGEWLVIMNKSPKNLIEKSHLPPEVLLGGSDNDRGGSIGADLLALPARDAREAFEAQYMEAQLVRFQGNITRTASFVGMERSALHRKLRVMRIKVSNIEGGQVQLDKNQNSEESK